MAHKISVTGTPLTPLRIIKSMMGKESNAPKVYSFDMEEGGGPPAKYLPKASKITFTVFVNERQITKAGIEEDKFEQTKIMVQGELVMDLDMKICPGEIGVTANQIQILPQKNNMNAESEKTIT